MGVRMEPAMDHTVLVTVVRCFASLFSKLKGQDDEKGFMKDDELGGNDLYEELQRKKPRSRGFMEPECPCCKNLSKRYTIALLSSLGFVISFGIRCNLSNAIVKMVEPVDGNADIANTRMQCHLNSIGLRARIGVMDSSFFWGYLVTQIPGGFLATKYPANRIFGTAIAISAFLNLLIPKSAQIHASMVMVVRILQGLVEIPYAFGGPAKFIELTACNCDTTKPKSLIIVKLWFRLKKISPTSVQKKALLF
ncbi:vesicular glutamate transporter 3 [Caerostris darwini]|uniref:Vesicular glutamate transporter 3 n=1 Tax=Caerostris darwini TaxID=1538125 RepID=A0AAV4N2T1_9ARAC|nr:vesicular glutamate transporter 3 [Caerostris darwini]